MKIKQIAGLPLVIIGCISVYISYQYNYNIISIFSWIALIIGLLLLSLGNQQTKNKNTKNQLFQLLWSIVRIEYILIFLFIAYLILGLWVGAGLTGQFEWIIFLAIFPLGYFTFKQLMLINLLPSIKKEYTISLIISLISILVIATRLDELYFLVITSVVLYIIPHLILVISLYTKTKPTIT
jgi:hypothetical protein